MTNNRQIYYSPQIKQCNCYCERGYTLSTPIDGWEDGDNRDGEAQ